MQPDYEIFEQFSDGSTLWRATITGWHEAQRKIRELGGLSENVFFAVEIPAGETMLPSENMSRNGPESGS